MKSTPIEQLMPQVSDDYAVHLGTGPTYRWLVTKSHVDMAMPMPAPLRADIPAEPQNITVDLKRSAMIVVDMQNDFCAEGGWCDYLGADLTPEKAPIGPLTRLLPALREAGVPIIWLNWGNRPDQANLEPPVLHIFKKAAAAPGIGEPVPGKNAPLVSMSSTLVMEPGLKFSTSCRANSTMASELIHECALAIAADLNVRDLAHAIHAHPTLTETLGEAAEDADGVAIHLMRQEARAVR